MKQTVIPKTGFGVVPERFFARFSATIAGVAASAIIGMAALTGSAAAQAFPDRPITMIVPFAPGGSADIGARVFAEAIGTNLGQTIIVENKPGAGSIVGTEALINSKPDGYTIMYNTSNIVLNLSLYDNLRYDPFTDLAPVALTATGPQVLVVPASSDIKTLDDLIKYLRDNPGTPTFGSSGNGNINHILALNFLTATDTSATHVPYQGGNTIYPDLISNRINFYFASVPASLGFIKEGQLRALATTSSKRTSVHPEVPTFAELGYPSMTAGAWQGIVAPADTPNDVIAILNKAIVAAANDPAVIDRLQPQGLEPFPSTPEEYAKFMHEEDARWKPIIKASGVHL